MLPYPHPDGAIAFRRGDGGEFVIRQDDRGRWAAFHRSTIYDWHFAYGDQISLTRYQDVPLVLAGTERSLPPATDPTEMIRTAIRAIDHDEVTWATSAPDDDAAPTSEAGL